MITSKKELKEYLITKDIPDNAVIINNSINRNLNIQ